MGNNMVPVFSFYSRSRRTLDGQDRNNLTMPIANPIIRILIPNPGLEMRRSALLLH